jgi:hypothetical protein
MKKSNSQPLRTCKSRAAATVLEEDGAENQSGTTFIPAGSPSFFKNPSSSATSIFPERPLQT